ncbi:MAG: LacI family DNA-binding transcriptional regulator [Oscillospiraceae bacterium]|jgi:LacI family sucrose operon transcriptional repressor
MASLKDVAKKAGISVTTVSRVLNNRGYIGEQTREKVYSAIKELKYQPNEIARSLSKKRINFIGVIVPSVMHPFFCKVVNYLEKFANEKGFKILLCNSNHEREKEIEYIEMLKANKVSGIVICSRTQDIGEHLDVDLPIVAIERKINKHPEISVVQCENYQGGVLAAKHLIEAGCKNVINISGIAEMLMPADERTRGFIDVCKEAGIEYSIYNTEEKQFYIMNYEEYLFKIVSENDGADGIFASSDIIAAQFIQACAKKNISIPNEMKIVGFDDIQIAVLTSPKLTTIHQPVEEMCKQAVEIILKKLSGEIVPLQTVLPVELIKRGTT